MPEKTRQRPRKGAEIVITVNQSLITFVYVDISTLRPKPKRGKRK